MGKLYYFVLSIFLLNIFSVVFSIDIFVNNNAPISYTNYEQCGNTSVQCVNLKDAGQKALFLSKIIPINESINIKIESDISEESENLGNLFYICNKLSIRSSNNSQYRNIDGSNSQQPFISFEEPNILDTTYQPCNQTRTIQFIFLSFINWNQTIIKINVNQETDVSDSKINISLNYFKTYQSNSIFLVQPKNLNQLYNYNAINIKFSNTEFIGISSSDLKVPSSLTESGVDYLPPFYFVGVTISGFITFEKCFLSLSPFIYLYSSAVIDNSFWSINDSLFLNGHPVLMVSNSEKSFFWLGLTNNTLSTLVYFVDLPVGATISFGTSTEFYNNTIIPFSSNKNNNNSFLGNKYQSSFSIIKNSPSVLINDYINKDDNSVNFVGTGLGFLNTENSMLIMSLTIPLNVWVGFDYFINTINSNITALNLINLNQINLSFIGSNSSIYTNPVLGSLKNESLCECINCSFFYSVNSTYTPVDISFCPSPSSESPTTTDVGITPIPFESSPSSSNKTRTIIIVCTILGGGSVASLALFSFIYKRYQRKKYILNSANNSNSSSEDGDLAAAAADNDVSPNLEAIIPYEDEDCAQLEEI